MIRAYPGRASVWPGDLLVLHVSTDSARFRVNFHRWADGLVPLEQTRWLPGKFAPQHPPDRDWAWPRYEFRVPADWPSGVYIAHFEESAAGSERLSTPPSPRIATDRGAALFIVRGEGRSRLLYKLPLNTWHAYNMTGGGCFYVEPRRSTDPPGSRVSLRRPGGGIGGETWGAADHYETSSQRQTFAHWDARFIRWLYRNGYRPEFCTDLDIHEDPGLCGRHRLLLSVGHDEYWSEPERDHVEAFVGGGGNVAFFGANVCWWRVHVVDDGKAIVCHQGGPQGALDHWWPPTGANRPEDSLTGVSYRHGGGWWDGPRRTGGYVVQQADHWVFAGTGLRAGEHFGDQTRPPLVGYECDGAPVAALDEQTGLVTLAPDRETTGTPPGFAALAAAVLGNGWQELPPRENHPAGGGIHAATMGIFSRGGTVFTAGTTDWAQVLADGDPFVEQITRNVVDGLLGE